MRPNSCLLSSSTAYVVRAEYTFNGQLFSEVVNVEVSEGIIKSSP